MKKGTEEAKGVVMAMIGNRRARMDARYRAALDAFCKAEERGDVHARQAAGNEIYDRYTGLQRMDTAMAVVAGLTDEDTGLDG